MDKFTSIDIDAACAVMHDAYEKAALGAGWETNPASRKEWKDVPPANQATMRAAVAALLHWLPGRDTQREHMLALVREFTDERANYVKALLNSGGAETDDSDYYRWSGHAEARRQLATALQWPITHSDKHGNRIPYRTGPFQEPS